MFVGNQPISPEEKPVLLVIYADQNTAYVWRTVEEIK